MQYLSLVQVVCWGILFSSPLLAQVSEDPILEKGVAPSSGEEREKVAALAWSGEGELGLYSNYLEVATVFERGRFEVEANAGWDRWLEQSITTANWEVFAQKTLVGSFSIEGGMERILREESRLLGVGYELPFQIGVSNFMSHRKQWILRVDRTLELGPWQFEAEFEWEGMELAENEWRIHYRATDSVNIGAYYKYYSGSLEQELLQATPTWDNTNELLLGHSVGGGVNFQF